MIWTYKVLAVFQLSLTILVWLRMDIVEYPGSALILILLNCQYRVYLGMLADQAVDTLGLEMFEQEDLRQSRDNNCRSLQSAPVLKLIDY